MRNRIWPVLVALIAMVLVVVGAVGPLVAQEAEQPGSPDLNPTSATTASTSPISDEGEISRTTTQVSNEVMSPFCPGKTLAMCPSPAAAEVRRDIQEMAKEGADTETIKRRLIEEYGDEFEIIEPNQFDNAVVLALVAAGLVLCVVVVLMISKRATRRRGQGSDDDDDDDDDDPGAGPTGGEDGVVDAPYLKELRDDYQS